MSEVYDWTLKFPHKYRTLREHESDLSEIVAELDKMLMIGFEKVPEFALDTDLKNLLDQYRTDILAIKPLAVIDQGLKHVHYTVCLKMQITLDSIRRRL